MIIVAFEGLSLSVVQSCTSWRFWHGWNAFGQMGWRLFTLISSEAIVQRLTVTSNRNTQTYKCLWSASSCLTMLGLVACACYWAEAIEIRSGFRARSRQPKWLGQKTENEHFESPFKSVCCECLWKSGPPYFHGHCNALGCHFSEQNNRKSVLPIIFPLLDIGSILRTRSPVVSTS